MLDVSTFLIAENIQLDKFKYDKMDNKIVSFFNPLERDLK